MTCVLLIFSTCVLMLHSISVGSLDVFSNGSTVLINLTIDISFSLIGCSRGIHISVFKRWVPPPPNPPPMTDEEKNLTIEIQLESLPQCDCGDRAVVCKDTAKYFVCPNIVTHKYSLNSVYRTHLTYGATLLQPKLWVTLATGAICRLFVDSQKGGSLQFLITCYSNGNL